ncbi:hypothetical protein EVA_21255, partial [gut metagenome]
LERQIVVLNVVGSNPTSHPELPVTSIHPYRWVDVLF